MAKRCMSATKNDEPCGNWAMNNSDYCRVHYPVPVAGYPINAPYEPSDVSTHFVLDPALEKYLVNCFKCPNCGTLTEL